MVVWIESTFDGALQFGENLRLIDIEGGRRVARHLDHSDCVVRRYWDQWIQKISFTRRPGSGRPRQISRREDRHIEINARIQPTASSAAIQAQVAPLLGVPVSPRTIRRCLTVGHLGSRRPLSVLPLTLTHRRLSLEWCHARGNWTAAEWNQVVFSDESRFNLSSDHNRVCVWRLGGECHNPVFALQRHTAPTAGVMVWGAIACNTRSPLLLIRGTTCQPSGMSMTFCNHMCCHSCNGSQEPFFNKTMLGLTRQRCHKTISARLLPFLGLPDPQIRLQSSISGILWDGASWGFHKFERTRGKATANMCSQLASLDKNNALREIKLRLSYLQGKTTTMSVIAHQTDIEWISANEKSRQRMSQTQAEGAAEQHAARLEDAHLQAHHSCFTTSERC
ncbi:transposable element Tcb2 transposase [Trichonephila clavipes]|nr:transposable element Tcb2 transposase [Trichonephila clavipes]